MAINDPKVAVMQTIRSEIHESTTLIRYLALFDAFSVSDERTHGIVGIILCPKLKFFLCS